MRRERGERARGERAGEESERGERGDREETERDRGGVHDSREVGANKANGICQEETGCPSSNLSSSLLSSLLL